MFGWYFYALLFFPTQRQSFPMLTIVYIENRLAPLYNFMTETMMTQDYSNPLVYWSVMGQMMTHFEVELHIINKSSCSKRTQTKDVYLQLMLKNAAEDGMMVVEKLKRMNITPDAITTTVQFHWASALVRFFFVFLLFFSSTLGQCLGSLLFPFLLSFFLSFFSSIGPVP